MGDGRAVGAFLGLLLIDVNPLMVAGCLGKSVDPLLIDLEPFLILPFVADSLGSYGLYDLTGGFGALTFYGQGVYLDASTSHGVGITNGLRIEFP